ncbi:MAG TPA: hypothetical protein VF162_16715, partial [Streptosporangiaceae bacterium]
MPEVTLTVPGYDPARGAVIQVVAIQMSDLSAEGAVARIPAAVGPESGEGGQAMADAREFPF